MAERFNATVLSTNRALTEKSIRCNASNSVKAKLSNEQANTDPSLSGNAFEGVETRRRGPKAVMQWSRYSPAHKQYLLLAAKAVAVKENCRGCEPTVSSNLTSSAICLKFNIINKLDCR